jgi:hypothetical protein
MRRISLALVAALIAAGTPLACAELIWDNFLTPDPANDGGFDGVSYFSSERNAAVEDSWAADDAVWPHEVTVQAIKWAGARDARFPYGYVELIILEEQQGMLEVVQQYSLGQPAILGTFGTFFGLQVYNGYIELPEEGISLPAGHYYFGVRLVNGVNGDEDGRNVMLTTGGGAVNGLTMGLFQSYFFGYPNWTFTADTSGNLTTDFAFQLYGIPEPASLVLLIAGGLLFRRR